MTRYTTSKDMNKVIHELVQKGWTVEFGKKHLKLRSPKGYLVTTSLTPSCGHAHKQVLRDVKRLEAGVYQTGNHQAA